MSTHPQPQQQDLTARARIRNATLELYAARGEDKVSMRTVAAEAGVTIGLIQHHFGTKEGSGRAVDDYVVSYFAGALATVEPIGTPAEVVEARDAAVQQMLRANPTVVRYINRALIEPDGRGGRLLREIVALTVREVAELRRSGHASTSRSDKVQCCARSWAGRAALHRSRRRCRLGPARRRPRRPPRRPDHRQRGLTPPPSSHRAPPGDGKREP
ncbi:TetR/AcrR family transcriptional regulator [Janibacter limosus]|uniref:TetR/AcrR family transcriptional regulator n=1 Tax=Janibacter limosus TaxID=53458 RepID=A0AC61U464_9MICO|nr:TetR/AcrR family transcriptional regulator [Janibacter limosus]UUZ44775.1 TetR/AcrR family transcriptional regulator [Janibacter limosus]